MLYREFELTVSSLRKDRRLFEGRRWPPNAHYVVHGEPNPAISTEHGFDALKKMIDEVLDTAAPPRP